MRKRYMRKRWARADAYMATACVMLALTTGCGDDPTAPGDPTGLRVTVESNGVDFPAAYAVTVNDSKLYAPTLQREAGPIATATFTGLPRGNHTVTLSEFPANCTVEGANPRVVAVVKGSVTPVLFAVSCVAITGVVEIAIVTLGDDPDPNGYVVQVDGGPPRVEPANTTARFGEISGGDHAVRLDEVASNCTVAGSNVNVVNVAIGGLTRDTARTAFEVTCVKTDKIAFTRYDGSSNPWITVAYADGSNAVQVTTGYMGSWSPDGTKLVFAAADCDYYYWYYYGCTPQGLFVMKADGQNLTRLTSGAFDQFPAWGPDGTKVAFTRGDRIYVMGANGSAPSPLVSPGSPADLLRASQPAWSPDGSRLAFTCEWGGGTDICLVSADGTGFVRLMRDGWGELSPAWSPDGTLIAFATYQENVAGESQIAVMRPDGSEIIPLVAGAEPAWSRDGGKIVFSRPNPAGLYTVNPDGSGLIRLTEGNDHAPAWRP